MCGLGLAALAALIQPRRGWISTVLAVALIGAVNWRTRAFFTDARPDMIAWLFAAAATDRHLSCASK